MHYRKSSGAGEEDRAGVRGFAPRAALPINIPRARADHCQLAIESCCAGVARLRLGRLRHAGKHVRVVYGREAAPRLCNIPGPTIPLSNRAPSRPNTELPGRLIPNLIATSPESHSSLLPSQGKAAPSPPLTIKRTSGEFHLRGTLVKLEESGSLHWDNGPPPAAFYNRRRNEFLCDA